MARFCARVAGLLDGLGWDKGGTPASLFLATDNGAGCSGRGCDAGALRTGGGISAGVAVSAAVATTSSCPVVGGIGKGRSTALIARDTGRSFSGNPGKATSIACRASDKIKNGARARKLPCGWRIRKSSSHRVLKLTDGTKGAAPHPITRGCVMIKINQSNAF